MPEEVLFQNGDVTVTTARVMFGPKTYALSGITSVRSAVQRPDHTLAIILIVVGLFCMLVPTIVGILMICFAKTQYGVMIASASGESQALRSTDAGMVNHIVAAINAAIVRRA